jgi:hypothetical protein
MDPIKQQIAIARACGWTFALSKDWPLGVAFKERDSFTGMPIWEKSLPDYLRDLNAMHDAEKSMDNETHRKFRCNLRYITGCGASTDVEMDLDDRAFVSATAAQRAEAFLRTIGRWEDS